ncbi:ABC transporter permease [Mucilaginibacter sp. HMF5004]|uniref:ABC transporter permease n=1 Tax=Mucilaginibacter rivuli TaxID=2857527 RepID=UPI001C5E027F|nr:ABC transporter permease [Mucilaginibacter rivuli]MBW4889514.1 ABC transporter permease [Mucilaginibacter rivuli]
MDFLLTAILQGLCFAGIALGIYISMKIFNIPDITTDGSYMLGAAITATLFTHGMKFYFILPLVICAGALAGVLTGWIHTKLKVNALLAGILVMNGLYSINLTTMGRSNLPLRDYTTIFTRLKILPDVNQNTLVFAILAVAIMITLIGYLLKTDFGIAMRATGNSETMIRSLGVNTDRMKIIGLAIANALTATSGYLMTQLQSFADINMGIGVVILGLGAVIIGETMINWFNITSVWKTLLIVIFGAILFQLVLALTLSLGINPNMLKIVTSCFVLLFVGIPRLTIKTA